MQLFRFQSLVEDAKEKADKLLYANAGNLDSHKEDWQPKLHKIIEDAMFDLYNEIERKKP